MRAYAAAVAVIVLWCGAVARGGQEQPAPETAPTTAPAAETTPAGPAPAGSAHPAAEGAAADHADPAPHPVIPEPAEWPGTVVIVILSMFLAAAVVGPIVRANMPEEVPPAHSHDEPPGASHHHGKSGILNPEPDEGHAGGHH